MLKSFERSFYMSGIDSPLDNIKIASPCSADWNAMAGGERKRFCGDCKLNVYNLSGMTKYDAENLLMNSEGRLCVRYFQRADGTVLTKDCPVGWARVKSRVSAFATAIIALIVTITGGIALFSMFAKKDPVIMGEIEPVNIGRRIDPPRTIIERQWAWSRCRNLRNRIKSRLKW